jgi:hypothetical protein
MTQGWTAGSFSRMLFLVPKVCIATLATFIGLKTHHGHEAGIQRGFIEYVALVLGPLNRKSIAPPALMISRIKYFPSLR